MALASTRAPGRQFLLVRCFLTISQAAIGERLALGGVVQEHAHIRPEDLSASLDVLAGIEKGAREKATGSGRLNSAH